MAELKVWITADSSKFIAGTDKATKSLESYRKKMMDTSKNAQERATNEDLYIKKLQLEAEAMHNSATSANEYVAWAKKLKQEQARVNATMGSSTKAYKAITEELLRTKNGMKELEAEQKKLNATTAQSGSKFGELLLNIIKFRIVMVATTQLWNAFSKTISESSQAAAEAEQVFNKLETVFSGVEKSAKGMAAALASSIGVANSTAASALSTVGDLLQAQGMGTAQSLSTASSWVSKFQDIIAFKDLNVSLEEFAQNFMSGAAGNLRNFRTFGSIVKESAVNARLASQGMDKLTGSELELAKMTARAEIALEQQANVMGATEREWETALSVNRRLTEAWKEYKENLGESLNTVMKPIKGWLADILDLSNDVSRALKEIKGGEFTIKVQQETTDSLLQELSILMNAAGAENTTGSSGFWGRTWASLQQAVANTDPIAAEKVYEEQHVFSAQQIYSIMMATGATAEQIKLAADAFGQTVTQDVLREASKLVDQETAKIKEQENLNKQWASASETLDNVLTNIGAISPNIDMYGYDSYISEAMSDPTNPRSQAEVDEWVSDIKESFDLAVQKAIESLGFGSLSSYQDSFSIKTGEASGIDALGKKMDDIKSLYEIISNYGVRNNEDVSGYLSSILGYYFKALEEQTALKAEEIRKQNYASGLSSMQGNVTSYANQMAQIGMTDNEKAIDNLRITYETLVATVGETEELKNAYDDQVASLKRLQAMQEAYNDELEKQSKIDSLNSTTADYGKQLRQLGMTDAQKTIDDLWAQITGDEELDSAINAQIEAFNKLTEATKEYEDELARQEAWQNLGQSALNSVGPVGSAINTMVNGEGDIWTRLLEVVLDIFQQSEHWSEVVDVLNQIIEPILPLVEMIAYTLSSLQPVWDVIAFVLKVISSLAAATSMAVNKIIDIFQKLWDDIKIGFKNIGTTVYNMFHWKDKRDLEEYKPIQEYWKETDDKYNDVLYKIWHGVEDLNDANISMLDDLLARKIIDLDQYNAGLRVAQKDMVFDPVTPAQYVASGSAGSSTVQYGNITLTINGGNIEETQRVVINVMREAGYDIGNVPLYA